jgi:hypothetical protein
LQDALLLYQQQAVITMYVDPPNYIIATVRDNQVFTTQLNIHLMGNSQCSCRQKETCVHLIALYFAAYAFQGFRPEIVVKKTLEQRDHQSAEPAKSQPIINAPAISATNPAPKSQENVKSTNVKNPVAAPPTAINSDDSVAIWHSYFHAKFKQFPTSHGFVDFKLVINGLTKNFTTLSQSWSINKKRLFLIHICLFQLQKLEENYLAASNHSSYYYSHGIKDAIHECYDRLDQNLMDIKKTTPANSDLPHLKQTAELLSIIAFPVKQSPVDWKYYYYFIWETLLRNFDLRATEKARLYRYQRNHYQKLD